MDQQNPLPSKTYRHDEERVTYFAETDSRNRRVQFGIKAKDRTRHMYVIGKTGMGKSTLLENLAIQDIQNGEGLAFIDPHGKSAEMLLEYVPKERINDVLYFAPFDMDNPISFNVMEDVGTDRRHLVVSGLMSAFKKIWVDAWSARMEYILSNTLLALLEFPGSTLLGINRVLADKNYRKKVVDNIKDPAVKSFWVDEFAKYTDRFAAEATPAIQNKVGQFTSNPLIRNIIGQPHSTFDLRKMMDERKIVILNLSKGRVGETNANLLGSMLITKIYLAAMSRADTSEADLKRLPNFYLYVDEFQSFANESFANILSEARKYKLNLTIAHQYVEQMSEEVRAAVFGNVGTMVSFRVGAFDSELLEKEFAPHFTAEDMVNLGFAQIYLKLMIDGVSSSPFSATTLPPVPKPAVSFVEEIMVASRVQFSHKRDDVEKNIQDWLEPDKPPERNPRENTRRESSTPAVAATTTTTATVSKTAVLSTTSTSTERVDARTERKSEKHAEQKESQDKFKNDLKDLLKAFNQKDVVPAAPAPTAETPKVSTPAVQPEKKAEEKQPQVMVQVNVVSSPTATAPDVAKKPEAGALFIPGVSNVITKKPDNVVTVTTPAAQPAPVVFVPVSKPAAPAAAPTSTAASVATTATKPAFSLRNDKKTPTPENLAGLRAALTAALNVKGGTYAPRTEEKKPAETKPATPDMKKEVVVEKKPVPEQPKVTPVSVPPTQPAPVIPPPKQEVPKTTPVQPSAPSATTTTPPATEAGVASTASRPKPVVPHEAIKKILES
jgi:hypothetical protein